MLKFIEDILYKTDPIIKVLKYDKEALQNIRYTKFFEAISKCKRCNKYGANYKYTNGEQYHAVSTCKYCGLIWETKMRGS